MSSRDLEVANVTEMITLAISIDVLPDHLFARDVFGELERFKDRTAVAATATEIVNLTATRRFDEALDEAHDISGMNVVADLLAFVAINRILTFLHIAL